VRTVPPRRRPERRRPPAPPTLTLADLRDGPPTVDVRPSCRLLGISDAHGYALIKEDRFPCRTIKAGGRIRVITASLLEVLEGKAGAA